MKSAIPTIDINKLFEDKTILKEVRYENSDVIGWIKKKDIDHEGVMVITGSIEVCSSERFIEGIKHNDDVSNNFSANSHGSSSSSNSHGGIHFDSSSSSSSSSSSNSNVTRSKFNLCCSIQDIVGN